VDHSSEISQIKTKLETNYSELRKLVEESNGSVTKLKENVQAILKKVKDEFTQSKTETQLAIEGIKNELASLQTAKTNNFTEAPVK
jgi:uncharacterized protein YPO0396